MTQEPHDEGNAWKASVFKVQQVCRARAKQGADMSEPNATFFPQRFLNPYQKENLYIRKWCFTLCVQFVGLDEGY